MDSILEARHVTVVYSIKKGLFSTSTVVALDDVSLSVSEGSSISIVGESGSGKTTLAKVLVGVQPVTKGNVLFYGKDVSLMSKQEFYWYRRNVQYIPQDPYSSFNPFRNIGSVLRDLALFHRVATRSNVNDVIRNTLEIVKLDPDEVLDKYPHQLSGGQLQRVALARALLLKPKVLIADEVVTMLDASLRVELIDLIKQIQREYKLAVLFITHDIALAKYFAEDGEMVVMYRGRIIERGYTKSIISNPKEEYTKLLLSSYLEPF
ncbi:ABC transporter ATP-binding protein [Vulcanisaeta thermophila]|uniref:ABC transporter ATP-binding protein n=1 Tax=Vulcanisaeta thermophila TaxID=867917 RepID=UPI000852E7F2|nr:ABC transporter ATP-binding protein [Vulcanisaeta thermophila]